MSAKARNYIFTLNNYTDDDIRMLKDSHSKFQYMVFGKEIAPTTGTPHLQGFVRFSNAVRHGTACALFNGKAFVEIMRGSMQEAWNYCTKDGIYEEIGVRPCLNAHLEGLDKRADQLLLYLNDSLGCLCPECRIDFVRITTIEIHEIKKLITIMKNL